MTSLSNHHSGSVVKLIYIGDSGTGKTGSLVSLVEAGYKLRILDLDNGLDSLVSFARRQCSDKLDNVDYETRRDKYKSTPMGPTIAGRPTAFVDSLKLMTKWSDDTDPAEWDDDTVFVLDSLTALGRVAFEWAKGLNPTSKDPRQWFYTAQRACEDVIALLTGEDFNTNVIVVSHITYTELNDGTQKGFPSAIGTALSKHIGKYFNTLILAETKGSGNNVKRTIRMAPTALIDLKNPAPFKFDVAEPLESGLATIFAKLKEHQS